MYIVNRNLVILAMIWLAGCGSTDGEKHPQANEKVSLPDHGLDGGSLVTSTLNQNDETNTKERKLQDIESAFMDEEVEIAKVSEEDKVDSLEHVVVKCEDTYIAPEKVDVDGYEIESGDWILTINEKTVQELEVERRLNEYQLVEGELKRIEHILDTFSHKDLQHRDELILEYRKLLTAKETARGKIDKARDQVGVISAPNRYVFGPSCDQPTIYINQLVRGQAYDIDLTIQMGSCSLQSELPLRLNYQKSVDEFLKLSTQGKCAHNLEFEQKIEVL